MEQSIIYPLLDVVAFISKFIFRTLSFGIMFAKDTKDTAVREFGFAERTDKCNLSGNMSVSAGRTEVKQFKDGFDTVI